MLEPCTKLQSVRGFGKIANWEPYDRPLALVLNNDTEELVQTPGRGLGPGCTADWQTSLT